MFVTKTIIFLAVMTINLRVSLILWLLLSEDEGTTIVRGTTRPSTRRHIPKRVWIYRDAAVRTWNLE
jgi:hypothetical protein